MKPAMKRLYAKGRLKPGEMNATESAYAAFLKAEQQSGRIEKFWFESMKVKIAAGKCWYTPDFMVLRPSKGEGGCVPVPVPDVCGLPEGKASGVRLEHRGVLNE